VLNFDRKHGFFATNGDVICMPSTTPPQRLISRLCHFDVNCKTSITNELLAKGRRYMVNVKRNYGRRKNGDLIFGVICPLATESISAYNHKTVNDTFKLKTKSLIFSNKFDW
jgi:hypothetical protein